jgi:hypothetical protein
MNVLRMLILGLLGGGAPAPSSVVLNGGTGNYVLNGGTGNYVLNGS